MTTEPAVTVIVSNYNGLRNLGECFESLERLDYGARHLMLMDNASSDGSVEYVRARFPGVTVVRNPKNLLFAGGMNAAMRRALDEGAEFIALLNDDTAVDRRWLSEMMRTIAASPDIGAVAPRLMFHANRRMINGIGVALDRFAYGLDRGQGELFSGRYARSEEVPAFTGGACLLRAAALRRVGLFDATFRAYYEDVDLSFRLRAAGWRVVTAPDAVVYHKHSASWVEGSPRKRYLTLRNRLLMMARYFPADELARRVVPDLIREQRREAAAEARRGDWRSLAARLRAFLSALRLLPRALRFRFRFPASVARGLYARCLPAVHPAALPYPKWDYRRPAEGERLPRRILVGVNDLVLGDGWLPLDCRVFPQARWMGRDADCFLAAEKGAGNVLQLHLFQPLDPGGPQVLTVAMDGERLGAFPIPRGEWTTLRIPCIPSGDAVLVSFSLDRYLPADLGAQRHDLGVQFNEVSLLPEGSPFIRDAAAGDVSPAEGGSSPR